MDGQRFEFDLSDSSRFPEFAGLYNPGEATGFVFFDQSETFAVLDKGLSVRADEPGEVKDAELEIRAHWDYPGATAPLEQFMSVTGSVEVSAPAALDAGAVAIYSSSLNPFLGQMGDRRSLLAAGTIRILDFRGPRQMHLGAARIDYLDTFTVAAELSDRLPAGMGHFAEANLIDSAHLVSFVVPESSTSIFLGSALTGLVILHLRRRAPRKE
jgi:hypothetical protein